MGTKQKIYTLLLVFVFGFVLVRVWHFAKSNWLAALADFIPEKIEPLDIQDTDGDGLSDTEESFYDTDFNNPDTDGDGYLDGEEVASGYNPRIPSPEDVKPGALSNRAASINLTDRINGRVLASIYEGTLNPNNPELYDQTLDMITFNTLLESVPIFQPPSVNESEILIDYSHSKEESQQYLNELVDVINIWIIPTQIDHLYELKNLIILDPDDVVIYDKLVNKYYGRNQMATELLKSIRVPKSWSGIHLEILDLLNQYKVTYEAMRLSHDDQLKAYLALQKLVALNQQSQQTAPKIIYQAAQEDLKIPRGGFMSLAQKLIGISL
jgi:hypothetical protein